MRFTRREVLGRLRQSGYKMTPQRRAVVRVIATTRAHLTPAAIHNKVRRDNPGIGLTTVYRTLGVLAGLGLVCQVRLGDAGWSYTISTSAPHHHLICSGCGKVIDLDSRGLRGLERKLAREKGFKVESLLNLCGLCQSCQKEGRVGNV